MCEFANKKKRGEKLKNLLIKQCRITIISNLLQSDIYKSSVHGNLPFPPL